MIHFWMRARSEAAGATKDAIRIDLSRCAASVLPTCSVFCNANRQLIGIQSTSARPTAYSRCLVPRPTIRGADECPSSPFVPSP